MARLIALLLVVSGSGLNAQQPLVGVWDVSFTAGMRIENGVATPIPGTGVLTISAQGDSLIGDLVNDPMPDRPARPPLRLAGVAGGERTTLVSRSTATIMRNGSQDEVTVIGTWTLSAHGDHLEGTVERKLEGIEEGARGPQPVTGTRRK